ncbi:MAG: bifunctional methylenetetrahydrofolate dehydrogenase/methenyltetrahydrofolate cyclohydrolase FolD [Bacteroidia bacterium]|nr:bifunctional methylenetetrahydrofolate dehydrogenase/methenyltetrahydrofolate cyclohydrolase FolD [Bacteroidia bacterium]
MVKILDGKALAEDILEQLKKQILRFERPPELHIILVGEESASQIYVQQKLKASQRIGVSAQLHSLPSSIAQNEVISLIQQLNATSTVDGIIVQLPLPHHIDPRVIIEAIDPKKDVDGFHPMNLGKLVRNEPDFIPATPLGILELFRAYEIETQGKHCVVLGRSMLVGMPISILMASKNSPGNCTVTICHSYTPNIDVYLKQADIVIVAIGKPRFIHGSMLKEHCVVVDVGIHKISNGEGKSSVCGDVIWESIQEVAAFATPVPGGVGPLTVAMLLTNTVQAYALNAFRTSLDWM